MGCTIIDAFMTLVRNPIFLMGLANQHHKTLLHWLRNTKEANFYIKRLTIWLLKTMNISFLMKMKFSWFFNQYCYDTRYQYHSSFLITFLCFSPYIFIYLDKGLRVWGRIGIERASVSVSLDVMYEVGHPS